MRIHFTPSPDMEQTKFWSAYVVIDLIIILKPNEIYRYTHLQKMHVKNVDFIASHTTLMRANITDC